MYCIFFTHSSVKGCLGCFRVLTIVNNDAVNIGACVFSNDSFLQIYAQALLDHMVTPFNF